ncbi:MAG TPA: HNH endonuclease signature motif containing protein [Rhodanobacter sp.]|nr:HNH endonuclease signature motif containing protein [Rhodanobacter sp.]
MAYWWVNHKQTRDHEVRGGYLWSPYRNTNGAFNQTYENMKLVRPGDIVFSYARGQIGAVGRVTEAASPSPKPIEFGDVGDYWSHEGWLVEVDFKEAHRPLSPKSHIESIGPMLPERNSPLQKNGNGNQGCYLAGISDALGHLLMAVLDMHQARELDQLPRYVIDHEPNVHVLDDIHRIENDASIPETQRLQLTRARVGQGFFRKQVILLDGACRVTGVTDTRLLIASHIKPWREASNAERLSGHNGLLLSPHVDALFDEQFITFEDDGRMRTHLSLPSEVLERWSINPEKRVERFRPEQASFLAHHRELFARKAARD